MLQLAMLQLAMLQLAMLQLAMLQLEMLQLADVTTRGQGYVHRFVKCSCHVHNCYGNSNHICTDNNL